MAATAASKRHVDYITVLDLPKSALFCCMLFGITAADAGALQGVVADSSRAPLRPAPMNNDRNPPRTRLRNLFHLAVGSDNLLHTEQARLIVRFTALDLSNAAALYNFLSPFSGTHWVEPRAYQAQVGWAF